MLACLLAGDAAHLVPIVGVRGLISSLEDASNPAWKLASVAHRCSPATCLGTYSQGRVYAAQINTAYVVKSVNFMTPPDFTFTLIRKATLGLNAQNDSVCGRGVRSLIKPRRSLPIAFENSVLNVTELGEWKNAPEAPGEPTPEALLDQQHMNTHLAKY